MAYVFHAVVAMLDLIFRVYKHIKSNNRFPDQE